MLVILQHINGEQAAVHVNLTIGVIISGIAVEALKSQKNPIYWVPLMIRTDEGDIGDPGSKTPISEAILNE